MPYTQAQQDNLNTVMEFLNFIKNHCPDIPRLKDIISNLEDLIKNNLIIFDSATVKKHEKSAPAVTINKEITYVLDDFGTRKFDTSNVADIQDIVHFITTLIHEKFHHLGSEHPTTYTETADLLKAILDCIKKNRKDFDKKYGPKAIADLIISQLEIQEGEERKNGKKKPKKKCFIATAAYGSELAPEVQFLRDIRDNVLRQMDWGRKYFDNYWEYYYKISPSITEKMDSDSKLREIVRWSIVTPWVNYMKLLAYRPDWDCIDMEGVEPELQRFLLQLRKDMDKWLSEVELPTSFVDCEPTEAIKELNVILNFVLRTGGLGYLDKLIEKEELPLKYELQQEAELLDLLRNAGRVQEEIDRILYVVK